MSEWVPKVGERVEVRREEAWDGWRLATIEVAEGGGGAMVRFDDTRAMKPHPCDIGGGVLSWRSDGAWYARPGDLRPLAAADEWEAVKAELRKLLGDDVVLVDTDETQGPYRYRAACPSIRVLFAPTPAALLAAVREKLGERAGKIPCHRPAKTTAPESRPSEAAKHDRETAAECGPSAQSNRSTHWNGTCPRCSARTWSGLGGVPGGDPEAITQTFLKKIEDEINAARRAPEEAKPR